MWPEDSALHHTRPSLTASTRLSNVANMPTWPTKASASKELRSNDPTSPAKATRHCTICKRPMLGHPKGRCADQDAYPATSPNKQRIPLRGSPARPQRIPVEDEQAERRRRRSSIPTPLAAVAQLPSLTNAGKDVIQKLMQPGIMDDTEMVEDSDRNRANVLRWLDNIEGPEEASGPMTNFKGSNPFSSPYNTTRPETSKTTPAQLRAEPSLPQIVKDKAAHAVVVDLDSARDMMRQMENKGFQVRALYPPTGSAQRHAWLIIGRDQATVNALVNRMLAGHKG